MQSVISKTSFNHPKRTAPNNIWGGVITQNKIWTLILLAMFQTAFFSGRVWGQSCEPIQPEIEPVFMEGNSPQCITYSENFANPNNYITVGIGTQYLSSASLAAAFGSSLENRNI